MKRITSATLPLVCVILLISTLVIQTFSNSLSFYDGLAEDPLIKTLLGRVYTIRDICLFSSICILLIYQALPKDSIVLVLLSIVAILFTFVIHPENIPYFQDVQTIFILCLNVYLVIRSNLVDIDLYKKVLRCFCYVLGPLAIYTFFTQQSTHLFIELYMDYSNAVSIVSALLLYFGIIENKKIDLVLGIITYIILLIAGSRGSFLTLSMLILGLIWLKYKSQKFLYFALIVSIISLLSPYFFYESLSLMSSTVDFDSRTIEQLINNDFLRGNDRYQLYTYLLGKAVDDGFLGGGICADRYYLFRGNLTDNGYYTHNILIELIVDFGIFGLLMFCLIIKEIYTFIKKYHTKKNICGFIFVFMFVSFVQLFFSRSMLTEPNLYIFMGLLIFYNYHYEYQTISKRNNSYL